MKKLAYCALLISSCMLFLTGCGKNNTVQVGDTVSIDFTSKFSDGTLFESSSMSFTVGSGEFVKGLENGVVGMKAGGSKTFRVAPDVGYGSLYDQNKVQKISQLIFDKTGIKTEKWTQAALGEIHGIIKWTETDGSGNQFVLFDINPKQTWDTLTFEINLLTLTKRQ